MLNKLIPYFIFLTLLFSCGQQVAKSKLKKILSSDGHPRWQVITKDTPNKYSSNIFALSYRGSIRGTGFVISGKRNILYTNAHVALPWKEMCKVECPKFIGMNRANVIEITGFHETNEFNGTDLYLDLAAFKFKWLEKNIEVKEMHVSPKLPSVGEEIHVVGFTLYEYDFVVSNGKVRSENYEASYKPSFHYDPDTDNLNSGSPVFNSTGELIGMHFGIPRGSEFNRAIPFNLIVDKYSQLF